MKRYGLKVFALLFAAIFMCGALMGCEKKAEETVAPAAEESVAEEHIAGMPNPVHEVDEAGMMEAAGFALHAPEGAEVLSLAYIDMGEGEPPLCEIKFNMDGKEWLYRGESTAKTERYDNTGMYYEWTETAPAVVDGREATLSLCEEAGIIYWLDVVPGFNYSLSCLGSVDGEELAAMATACFEPLQGEA